MRSRVICRSQCKSCRLTRAISGRVGADRGRENAHRGRERTARHSTQATQAAGEFEAYWGRWTLRGIVGAEFGNSASTFSTTTSVIPPAIGIAGAINTAVLTQSYDVKSRFMDQINLQYYVTDDWHAYLGHRYLGGKNALALGSELEIGRAHV